MALVRTNRLGARSNTRASTRRSAAVASETLTRLASSMASLSVSDERASHAARRTRADLTMAAAPSFSARCTASRNASSARESFATSRHRA